MSEDHKDATLLKETQLQGFPIVYNFRNSAALSLLISLSLFGTLFLYFFLRSWQLNLIVSFQQIKGKFPMIFFEMISDTKSVISIGVPLVIFFVSYFRYSKILRNKAIFITISLITSGLLSYGIKNALQEPRPYEIDNRIEKFSGGGGYGFPSGHVAEATAVVAACFIIWPNTLVFILSLVWILLIMASRVYLGVHDIYQVFGGMFIGGISPFVGNIIGTTVVKLLD